MLYFLLDVTTTALLRALSGRTFKFQLERGQVSQDGHKWEISSMSTMQIRGFWLFPIVLESTVRPHAPQLKQGLTLTVMMVKSIDFGQSKMFKSKTIKYESTMVIQDHLQLKWYIKTIYVCSLLLLSRIIYIRFCTISAVLRPFLFRLRLCRWTGYKSVPRSTTNHSNPFNMIYLESQIAWDSVERL